LILRSQGYDSEEEIELQSVIDDNDEDDDNNQYDGEKKCKIYLI